MVVQGNIQETVVMPQLPKDTASLSIDRKGMGIVHNEFAKTGNWEFRQITGRDVGTDSELELIENEEFTGFTFNVQVKSTKTIDRLANKTSGDFSISIEISTMNYWLNKSSVFLLVLVDVLNSDVYFLPVQDYLIEKSEILNKLNSEQKTITLRIPKENLVREKQEILKGLVKKSYSISKQNENITSLILIV